MPRSNTLKQHDPVSQSLLLLLVLVFAGLLVACESEAPRSYSEYLEDPIAREATILRCKAGKDVSKGNAECINAKRAAAALAAQGDGEKRRRFEAESKRKQAALRERIAAQQAAEARLQAEAKRRADAAYQQGWSYSDTGPGGDGETALSPEPHQDVYTGQQFPAEPLQPGMSTPSEPRPSNAAASYLGGEMRPGYSVNNGNAAVAPSDSTDLPMQGLPEAEPTTTQVPSIETSVTPPAQEVAGDSSAADPSWQPFEPPPADQPGEG